MQDDSGNNGNPNIVVQPQPVQPMPVQPQPVQPPSPYIQPEGPPPPGTSFVAGGGYSMPDPSSYTQTSGARVGSGVLLMSLLAGLNLIFLLVTVGYSMGVGGEAVGLGGTSFFVMAVMAFLAGGSGLFFAQTGSRLSKLAGSPLFTMINRLLFLGILGVAILIVIGPVIT